MNRFTERAVSTGMRLTARVLAAGRLQTIVSGAENIPQHGPALLVARHYHHFFDGIALFAALDRPFHILVTLDWAQSLVTWKVMTFLARVARWPVILRPDALSQLDGQSVFSAANVMRCQRSALREAADLLAAGRILVIFPEGYPTIDPHYTPKTRETELLPFKRGFLAIAAAAEKRRGAKIPLIPVGLHYTVGKKWTAHIDVGAPIKDGDFSNREGLVKKAEREVARLSGLS